MSGLREVARFSNSIDAGMARSQLEAEGLHCVLFDLNLNSGEGSFMYLPVRLMVLEEDLDEARECLDITEPVAFTRAPLQGWRSWLLIWFLVGTIVATAVIYWLSLDREL